MTVALRRIRPDEAATFRAIRLQALRDSPTAFGSTLADTETRPMEYWEERAQNGAAGIESVLFVAEEAGTWVGVVGGFLSDSNRHVDLISMWVAPGYRGRSVGVRLVEHVIAWARQRKADRVVLWVTEGNAAATRLYRRCGFTETPETQVVESHPHLRERQMVLRLTVTG